VMGVPPAANASQGPLAAWAFAVLSAPSDAFLFFGESFPFFLKPWHSFYTPLQIASNKKKTRGPRNRHLPMSLPQAASLVNKNSGEGGELQNDPASLRGSEL
jgi:hypothetical protein